MDITYLGHSCFRIKTNLLSIVCDPFDPKMVGLRLPSQEADLVTISHHHKDHDNLAPIKNIRKVIDGPGEYEVGGVSVRGYQTYHDDRKGESRGGNIIYLFEAGGIKILHLGDLGHVLSDKLVEEIGEVNVVMIPVGGEYTIGPEKAVEVANRLGAQITIPMHYLLPGMNQEVFGKLAGVDEFLKLINLTVEKLPKLSVKFADLGEDQKIVVLERK
jgi:L-ascorbate metabolism protein UlaG (beta-lactamase superfamily)